MDKGVDITREVSLDIIQELIAEELASSGVVKNGQVIDFLVAWFDK